MTNTNDKLKEYNQAMEIDSETGKPMQKVSAKLDGSYYRLAAEVKPTALDGVQDGDDLLLVDAKEVYIFYKGVWYLQ